MDSAHYNNGANAETRGWAVTWFGKKEKCKGSSGREKRERQRAITKIGHFGGVAVVVVDLVQQSLVCHILMLALILVLANELCSDVRACCRRSQEERKKSISCHVFHQ